MTIICAVYDADARKFLLGCNSGALLGEVVLPEHGTKWLRFANWAIALSGRGVARDAVDMERAKFPNQTSDISQIVSFLRAALLKFDLGETRDGAKDFDISALVAHSGGDLFHLDSRLAVSRIPRGVMWAEGSGMDYALGAEAALKTKGFSPQERLETAVLTAIDLDSGCPGEPIIETFG